MRNTIAKKLRKVLGLTRESNPIIRRTYRRFKKLYARTPDKQKPVLLQTLEHQLQSQPEK